MKQIIAANSAMHTIISENTIVNAAPKIPATNTANTIRPIIIALKIRNSNITFPFSYV